MVTQTSDIQNEDGGWVDVPILALDDDINPEDIVLATPMDELKAMVELYYDVQKFRLRGNNRMKALERRATSTKRIEMAQKQLKGAEVQLAKMIADQVDQFPATPWLKNQRGIGPVLAGAIIASGLDPNIDKPSSWWRFAGVGGSYRDCLGPNDKGCLGAGGYRTRDGFLYTADEVIERGLTSADGLQKTEACPVCNGTGRQFRNQRKRRGEKVDYNMFLRRTLEVAVSSFLKSHQPDNGKPSFYATLYYQFRHESERDRPELSRIPCPGPVVKGKEQGCVGDACPRCKGKRIIGSAIHHHRRAVMLVQRVFLTHLQAKWRAAIDLPAPRDLYIVARDPGVHETIPAPD